MLQREARAVVKALEALSWNLAPENLGDFGRPFEGLVLETSFSMPLAHLVDPFKQVGYKPLHSIDSSFDFW